MKVELPCIINKCILYPVCRHKTTINCWDLLLYWIKGNDNTMNIYLPNLTEVGYQDTKIVKVY